MPKKREKISDCPPSVRKLLSQANSLPKDFTDSLATKLMIEHLFVNDIEKDEEKRFYEIVEMLPKDFFDNYPELLAVMECRTTNVSSTTQPSAHTHKQWKVQWVISPCETSRFYPVHLLKSEISWASSARGGLYKAIELSQGGVSTASDQSRSSFLRKKEISDGVHLFEIKVVDGVIKGNYTFPFNILIGESIDTRRIKNCRVCKKFFWVKRLNENLKSDTCEKCTNTLRQNRFAEKNKDEIKIQRRKAYYHNKGVKILCEKCGRPQIKCGGC